MFLPPSPPTGLLPEGHTAAVRRATLGGTGSLRDSGNSGLKCPLMRDHLSYGTVAILKYHRRAVY